MRGLPDLYAVLHLNPEATAADIQRAYRSLMRRHHPDTRPAPATQAQASQERDLLTQIMNAHAVLGDPIQRASYDHDLTGNQLRQATGPGDEVSRSAPSKGTRVYRPHAPQYGRPPLIVGPLRWAPPHEDGY